VQPRHQHRNRTWIAQDAPIGSDQEPIVLQALYAGSYRIRVVHVLFCVYLAGEPWAVKILGWDQGSRRGTRLTKEAFTQRWPSRHGYKQAEDGVVELCFFDVQVEISADVVDPADKPLADVYAVIAIGVAF